MRREYRPTRVTKVPTASGEMRRKASEVGIYFTREPPKERGGTFDVPVEVVSVQPHMHLRGKAMHLRAVFPDRSTAPLIDVPKYGFNPRTTYFLKQLLTVPAGGKSEYLPGPTIRRTTSSIPIRSARSHGA